MLQGESAEQRVLVEVLHPPGEPGRGHGAAAGAELADLLAVGDPGDGAGPGRGGPGESRSDGVSVTSHVLQEPVLSRDQPAFQYSSHVSLQAPSGHMW